MLSFTDQMGKEIRLPAPPQRIISLVPSQSELLWDLGLQQALAGITKFCIHPEAMYKTIPRVGGTKLLHLEKIRALKPDLIIGNKEENERAQIEALREEFPVWMSDIYNLQDAFNMIQSLGEVTGKQAAAEEILAALARALSGIQNLFSGQRVAYFIWKDPYMLAGRHTFIDQLLRHLGFQNTAEALLRYPVVDVPGLQQIDPDICFLSSEPYPFREKHVAEMQKLLPRARVLVVDGELFSWYGSRLLHLEPYAMKLQHLLSLQA